jgi:hypothetical protein
MRMKSIKSKKQLVILISLLLISGFLITGFLSYFISLSVLREQITSGTLPLTSDNVYSEVQRDLLKPIFIASLMAHDSFLRDWILEGERDVLRITRYLKGIMTTYNTVTSFFVSEKTRIYYHADGILKRVDPNEQRDVWYFRVRGMIPEYEINIEPDLANRDTLTIFINHRVFDYNGNFIGATGVGLTETSLIDVMEEYDQKYHRNVFFIDPQGKVMLRGYSPPDTAGTIHDMEGISEIAAEILSDNTHGFEFKRQGKTVYLNSRFVPELNWYLLVEQTDDHSGGKILHALIITLSVCALITAIIITITVFSIDTYYRINMKQQTELTHKNSDLEKALLKVRHLSGLLPICSKCRRIRDDKGNWNKLEAYIKEHAEVSFSHGLCPECAAREYGEYYKDENEDIKS